MKKVSIIVSTYKQIKQLELVFAALNVQSSKEFEVIIADDGTGDAIHKFIKDNSAASPFDVTLLTQEDRGFRKNKILNKAIVKAAAPYLIFLDGDCVPHFDFVKHHLLHKNKNTVLCGRRVNLSKKMSDEITKAGILKKESQKVSFKHFIDSMKNKKDHSTYVEHGIVVENKLIRKIFKNDQPKIVGCNFSLHKSLIEKINGFDENYIGPGIGEDSDIEFRLRLINTKLNSLRNLAVVFHLYHKSTKVESNNYNYYLEVLKKKEAVCKNGITKIDNF